MCTYNIRFLFKNDYTTHVNPEGMCVYIQINVSVFAVKCQVKMFNMTEDYFHKCVSYKDKAKQKKKKVNFF